MCKTSLESKSINFAALKWIIFIGKMFWKVFQHFLYVNFMLYIEVYHHKLVRSFLRLIHQNLNHWRMWMMKCYSRHKSKEMAHKSVNSKLSTIVHILIMHILSSMMVWWCWVFIYMSYWSDVGKFQIIAVGKECV